VDPRVAAGAVVAGIVLLTVSLGVPAGAGVAARMAIDWLVVTMPVVLAALGRPVSRT
jgi:hypothetical protein